jgi:hypothetical protein
MGCTVLINANLLALALIDLAVDDLKGRNGNDFDRRNYVLSRVFFENVEWVEYLCVVGGLDYVKLMDSLRDELSTDYELVHTATFFKGYSFIVKRGKEVKQITYPSKVASWLKISEKEVLEMVKRGEIKCIKS